MAKWARRMLEPGWFEALLALLSLAVSVPRVARDVVLMGDSAALIAAASEWGVPAAPGHAIYTSLAHLATRVPLGSVALRVHLTSAAYHALCIGLSALLARRLAGRWVASLGTALILSFAPSFLLGSLYAEVNALSDAIFALLLLLSYRAGRAEPGSRLRALLWLVLAAGVGLSHTPLTLLFLPAVVVLAARALFDEARSPSRRALWLLVALVAPLVSSAALTWFAARRGPAVSSGDIHDIRSLFGFLTSDTLGVLSATGAPAVDSAGERVGALVLLLGGSVGPFAAAAAVVGVLWLAYANRNASVGLLLAFVFSGPVCAAAIRLSVEGEVAHASFERLFSMTHVPIAVLGGVGVAVVAERASLQAKLRTAIGAGLAAILGLSLWPASLRVDLSSDGFGRALTRDLLWNLPADSLVLVSGDRFTSAAQYACVVDRRCAELVVVAPGRLFVPWERARVSRRYPDLRLPAGKMSLSRTHEIVAAELPRRPVFVVPSLMLKDRELSQRFKLVPAGLLLRVFASAEAWQAQRAETESWVRSLVDARDCQGCQLPAESAYRPSQHIEVLMAYSVMFEGAARHARVLGMQTESRTLFARARRVDGVIGFDLIRLRGAEPSD